MHQNNKLTLGPHYLERSSLSWSPKEDKINVYCSNTTWNKRTWEHLCEDVWIQDDLRFVQINVHLLLSNDYISENCHKL
jgi:hypothetical protein